MAPIALSALELPADLTPIPVAGGYTSLEGPAWSDREQCLYFSNQNPPFGLHRYVPGEGASLFEPYDGKVNGNLVLEDGSLVTCESGRGRLVRRDREGTLTELADVDPIDGQALNEPNDVVLKSDGTFWFTTPSWPPNERQFVYAHDPVTRETRRVVGGHIQPNGLGFSPDERWFYLMEFGANRLLRFPVGDDGTLGDEETLVEDLGGGPDGMKVDHAGNIYACVYTAGHPDGGVNIFSPDGTRLAHISVPGTTTNVAFGGAHRQDLYITSGDTLYRIDLSEAYPIERPEVVIECSPTEVTIEWDSIPGQDYWVERSDDMETWERLPQSVAVPPAGGMLRTIIPNEGDRFYRVHPVWSH